MSSKAKRKASSQAPNPKRANAPLKCDRTKAFDKDWDRIKAPGRQDLRRAKDGMVRLIANEGPLPPEFLDHPLNGEWAGHREFHAGGDLLVIYLLREGDSVIFVRVGTHAELFE